MSSILSKAVREPLLHFALAAAALFVVAAVLRRDDDVIEVTRAELDYRILQVEAREATTLTEAERRLVEEAYIDERVLIREARAMDLEADERIDDILIQKMLHILSGDVIQPTDEELAAYYEQHKESYATDAAVTVDEVVLVDGGLFPRSLLDGAPPEGLPAGTLVDHRVMERLTFEDLTQIFGEEGAAAISGAQTGDWWQAEQSSRGQHWVRVRERFGTQVPELAVVRDAVRLDWIAAQEQERLLARVSEIRRAYTIVVEGR